MNTLNTLKQELIELREKHLSRLSQLWDEGVKGSVFADSSRRVMYLKKVTAEIGVLHPDLAHSSAQKEVLRALLLQDLTQIKRGTIRFMTAQVGTLCLGKCEPNVTCYALSGDRVPLGKEYVAEISYGEYFYPTIDSVLVNGEAIDYTYFPSHFVYKKALNQAGEDTLDVRVHFQSLTKEPLVLQRAFTYHIFPKK